MCLPMSSRFYYFGFENSKVTINCRYSLQVQFLVMDCVYVLPVSAGVYTSSWERDREREKLLDSHCYQSMCGSPEVCSALPFSASFDAVAETSRHGVMESELPGLLQRLNSRAWHTTTYRLDCSNRSKY